MHGAEQLENEALVVGEHTVGRVVRLGCVLGPRVNPDGTKFIFSLLAGLFAEGGLVDVALVAFGEFASREQAERVLVVFVLVGLQKRKSR